MKNIITKVLKKHVILIIIELILIVLNVYLLTVPSTITGKIIDLLYNLDGNKQNILKQTGLLLISCILILITRVIWKMLDAKFSRNLVKEFRDRLFEKLLKIDVSKLQQKKNGDIMSYFVKDIQEVENLFQTQLQQQ